MIHNTVIRKLLKCGRLVFKCTIFVFLEFINHTFDYSIQLCIPSSLMCIEVIVLGILCQKHPETGIYSAAREFNIDLPIFNFPNRSGSKPAMTNGELLGHCILSKCFSGSIFISTVGVISSSGFFSGTAVTSVTFLIENIQTFPGFPFKFYNKHPLSSGCVSRYDSPASLTTPEYVYTSQDHQPQTNGPRSHRILSLAESFNLPIVSSDFPFKIKGFQRYTSSV